MVLEMLIESGTRENVIFTRSYEVTELKSVFQEGICVNYLLCTVCLNWTNLVLTDTQASGCGSLTLACLQTNYPYDLGCFADNSVVPKCFGTCPNNCSSHGSCVNGFCQCNGSYGGDDCSMLSCPSDCSGHGICNYNNGQCTCQANYISNDCSVYSPPVTAGISTASKTHTSGGSHVATIVFIVAGVITVIGLVVAGVWYIRKRRAANIEKRFTQLEMNDEDEELVGTFETDEKDDKQ